MKFPGLACICFCWAGVPSYVERRADQELYEGLVRGEYCYVLTSRQMGKSSLMVRAAARLREEGAAVAVLDLTRIGQNLTPKQWYEGLLDHLGRYLDLEDELEAFWEAHDGLSPLQRWMTALREVVLGSGVQAFRRPGVQDRQGTSTSPSPSTTRTPEALNARMPERPSLVIFIDEIDAVRSLPFSADEFFAAIRECSTRRAEDPQFNRLTFCLLGVALPSDLIQDTRTTPFNIGRRIELTDFTEAEAAPLARGLAPDALQGKAILHRILYWTGGHPYLTQRLCEAVAQEPRDEGRGTRDEESPGSSHPSSLIPHPSIVDRHCEELFLSAPGARAR